MTKEQLDKLYSVLTSQTFYDYYDNELEMHIVGEADCLSREEILEDLMRMFR